MNSSRRPSNASPKHKWHDEDRLLLILFDLCFDNHTKDFTGIFNRVRKRELRRERFTHGIPASSIVAQLHEFKRGGTGSRLFDSVCHLSQTQLHNIFAEKLRTIRETARQVGVQLIDKRGASSGPIHHPQFRPQPQDLTVDRRTAALTMTTETSITTWTPEDNISEEVYTPTRRPRLDGGIQQSDATRLPTYVSQQGPYFVYRAFEVRHGLTARRFLDPRIQIPPPPRFESRAFEAEVRPHLERNKDYASPFVSFAQNPAVALKHAFNKVCQKKMVALAIVRYDDIVEDAARRFGPDCKPYLTPAVCRQHELWDLPGSYTGTGEFLVWGSFEGQPVALINCVNTLLIRALMIVFNRKVGTSLGEDLAKHLPTELNDLQAELFLFQLIKGCRVKGHLSARKSTAYFDLVEAALSNRKQNVQEQAQEQEEQQESDEGTVIADEDPEESDLEILEVRPVAPSSQLAQEQQQRRQIQRRGFAPSEWRSETTSANDDDWILV